MVVVGGAFQIPNLAFFCFLGTTETKYDKNII